MKRSRERKNPNSRHFLSRGILVMALVITISLLGTPLRADDLSPMIKEALLKGDWESVQASLYNAKEREYGAVAHFALGHALLASNCNDASLTTFLSASPEDVLKWKHWTEALIRAGEHNTIAHYLYGDALARSGDFSGAIKEFDISLKLSPQFSLAYNARGVAHAVNGDMNAALEDVGKATEIAPNFTDARLSLGALFVLMRNADGAKEQFEKSLERTHESALASNGLGCALFSMGKMKEAYSYFVYAAETSPALSCAWINQGHVLTALASSKTHTPTDTLPGGRIDIKSQTLVVDIPGILTQGEERPNQWGPYLIPGSSYQRINIRHDGVKGLKEESGLTITLAKSASEAEIKQSLKPVLDAITRGEHVYLKIDQDIGIMRYMDPRDSGGRSEREWAGRVANLLAKEAHTINPNLSTIANAHSEGTLVLRENLDAKYFSTYLFESPRFGADSMREFAQAHKDRTIIAVTADNDFGHGGRGYKNLTENNVTHINLKSPIPLVPMVTKAVVAHSDVQNPNYVGTFETRGFGLDKESDGKLGAIVSTVLEQQYLAKRPQTQAVVGVPKDGVQAKLQELDAEEQNLFVKSRTLNQGSNAIQRALPIANGLITATVLGQEGVRVVKTVSEMRNGGPVASLAFATKEFVKSLIGKGLEDSVPNELKPGVQATVGNIKSVVFDDLSVGGLVRQALAEGPKVLRNQLEAKQQAILSQVASYATRVREIQAERALLQQPNIVHAPIPVPSRNAPEVVIEKPKPVYISRMKRPSEDYSPLPPQWGRFTPNTVGKQEPDLNGPKGVDMRRFAEAYVDRGDWPVITLFGLAYLPPHETKSATKK